MPISCIEGIFEFWYIAGLIGIKMEYKLNQINKSKQEIEIEATYDELAPHFNKALEKYKLKAIVPGFRKGKVPVSMLKRMYGEAIEHGSLEDIANDLFRNYLEDNKINPINIGSLVDLDYQPKQLFKFKVQFEVMPELVINQYIGIEITKYVYEVDEKMIDEEIKYLRSKHSTFEETDKCDDENFVINADVEKLDDSGVSIIGSREKDIRFYLNDPNVSKELKKQLLNIHKGEEKTLSLTNTETKKKEKYNVNVSKIEKVIQPELNEEFFKHVYKDEIKTEKEFREKVKDDIEKIYKNISDQQLKNDIVTELIRVNDITVPDSITNRILQSYLDDAKNKYRNKKLPPDFDTEEFKKTKRVDAILQAKWYLLRDKLIELEKIKVEDEDIAKIVKEDSAKYNLPEEKLTEIYKQNENMASRILDDKLMDFLISNAKITEVKKEKETNLET